MTPNLEYGPAENWIGVDLDGTLAEYKSGQYTVMGAWYIGPPIKRMLRRVKRWRAQGKVVKIFTARVDGGSALAPDSPALEEYRDVEKMRRCIEQWCIVHVGEALPVTNVKDYGMLELWDDRAVGVERNTGRLQVARSAVLSRPSLWYAAAALLGLLCAEFSAYANHRSKSSDYQALWEGQFVIAIILAICAVALLVVVLPEAAPWKKYADED